jgi:hypothetical protein
MNYSRESTVTQGWDDEIDVSDGGAPVPEDVPDHLLKDSHSRVVSKRLIIAVDFGTTYSAVSFVALEEGESTHYLDVTRIRSIQNFPNDWTFGTTDRMKSEVPTEVFYPLDPGFREKEDLEAVEEEDNHAEFPVEPPLVGHNGGSLAVFGYDQDNDHGEDDMPIDETATFRWGYGVHEAWGQLSMHSNPKNRALARFKLLLDDSPMTEAIRNELGETLGHLKKKGIISDPHHVLVDFLTCLLRHTKLELRSFGFDESYRMEIVLCVPAIWRQKACRDMQAALARAMERARFEGVDVGNKSVENLFIVSEPEAAAAYVLETERSVSVRFSDTPCWIQNTLTSFAAGGHIRTIGCR